MVCDHPSCMEAFHLLGHELDDMSEWWSHDADAPARADANGAELGQFFHSHSHGP